MMNFSKELMEYVTDRIDSIENKKKFEYKSFLKGLERRQQTLHWLHNILLRPKQVFNGTCRKKAISNEEIAEKLNINPSTVSRNCKK